MLNWRARSFSPKCRPYLKPDALRWTGSEYELDERHGVTCCPKETPTPESPPPASDPGVRVCLTTIVPPFKAAPGTRHGGRRPGQTRRLLDRDAVPLGFLGL